MKKLLLALVSIAVMSSFIACDDEDEVYLGKQIEEASVTYTVPIYRPSLEWTEYIITYTDSMGISRTATISSDNFNTANNIFITSEPNGFITSKADEQPDKAFWVKNENFTTIPDSCCVKVCMRCKSNVDMPDRMDLIVPQPDMTAVVRYTDGTQRSVIGVGLDCNVVSVETETDLFKNIFEKEYYSTCTFYPSVQITDGRK